MCANPPYWRLDYPSLFLCVCSAWVLILGLKGGIRPSNDGLFYVQVILEYNLVKYLGQLIVISMFFRG